MRPPRAQKQGMCGARLAKKYVGGSPFIKQRRFSLFVEFPNDQFFDFLKCFFSIRAFAGHQQL